ncbi:hypothetical protein P775_09345 [Puniceibacterium antarcticum]|uniref:Uncharacterized protein n=1 Tax=Puniceibacterium antarcticum TaxID=1206336 RepID=A0A2G8RGR5_9RHOB|nr:hypothetical protein [Puniceibacterium antarcticum]PIL20720.1 hypothetical protein P775_09345 [Puniceibacterium antarcticum]
METSFVVREISNLRQALSVTLHHRAAEKQSRFAADDVPAKIDGWHNVQN